MNGIMGEIFLPDPEISREEEMTKSLNMTVLKRRDHFVQDILITAPHVVMYEFDLQHNQWNRKDIEGSLFVVKRIKQPRFQLIVMNRRNTANLVEDLLGKLEFEMEMPYLMYKNNSKDVNGIWFYQPHCCQAVFDLFNRLFVAYKKAPPKRTLSSRKSEFEELEAVPTKDVIDGPLEPNAMSAPFRSFFSNLSVNDTRQSVTPVGQLTPHERPHQTPPQQIQSGYFPSQPAFFESPPENPMRPSNFTSPPSDISQFFNRSSPSPTSGQTLTVGAPILQPFPPPKPSASLSQNSNVNFSGNLNSNVNLSSDENRNSNRNLNSSGNLNLDGNLSSDENLNFNGNLSSDGNHGQFLNREMVRNALTRLAQNENYVEMVYQEILKAQKEY